MLGMIPRDKDTYRKKIGVLSALYIKQVKNIMKYQLYTNALKSYQ